MLVTKPRQKEPLCELLVDTRMLLKEQETRKRNVKFGGSECWASGILY